MYRLGIITLLVVIHVMVLFLAAVILNTNIHFSHFAYIPIVLSGIWWDRKAVFVASILGLITIGFYHIYNSSGHFLDMLLIPAFFIFIALFSGTLSIKLKSQHKALIETEKKYLLAQLEAEQERTRLAAAAKIQEDQLVHSTRLAELGEMAAAIAHELNQPLTGIKNYAKNALYMFDEKSGTSEDIKDNLLQISRQVDRSARIISQLRDLARNSERQFLPVNINDIARESLEFLKPHLMLSGIGSSLSLDDAMPLISGDKVRLEQVLLNIITNARQAMEGVEERHLAVRSFFEENDPLPVTVEIRDTGHGFRKEDAEKFFTPFYTTKKPGHGTGLGLSISLSIIKDHHGLIEATGEVGRGACFTLKFPLAKDLTA